MGEPDEHETLLHIYLNDHLAGSTAGYELARRCLENNEGTPLAEVLDDLTAQIAEDRETLERLMDRLGAPRNPAKIAAAWVAEKVGRLKLNGQFLTYSPLSRLIELEGLAMGIFAKGGLWRALAAVRDRYPQLAELDLDELDRRAGAQLATVEAERAKAAATAFGRSVAPA